MVQTTLSFIWILLGALSLLNNAFALDAVKLVADCEKKVPSVTNADMEDVKNNRFPKAHTGVCLVECLFDATGMMTNGKVNANGFVTALSPAMGGDATKLKKLKELADVCAKEVAKVSDRCAAAKALFDCSNTKGKPWGFKFPSYQ